MSIKTISRCLLVPLLASMLGLSGCDRADEAHSLSGQTMGTRYNIKYYGAAQSELQGDIDAVLSTLDSQLSTYRPDSEISRFNQSPANEWFPVSPATAKIVAAGQEISRLSDGAFDMTVGPLVELWGFGAGAFQSEPPSAELIAERLNYVGFEFLDVRSDPPALKKQHAKTSVDLSAIAKGYAVDELAQLLNKKGITNWLVEVGGELRASGKKSNGEPWKVAIEKPLAGSRSVQKIISLENASLATSGDYRNFFEYNNIRYSHSINPKTGWPVPSTIGAVSVIADDAMDADAWATALLVTGEEKALKLSTDNGLAISMSIRDDAGNLHESMSPAFVKYADEQQ